MLEPVTIELLQHHAYRSRGPRTRGCAVCARAKLHPDHLGAPTSFQAATGSGNQFAYQAMKKAWQQLLAEQLDRSGLPRGLAHVLAEGQCTFPDRHRRDQGNHRFMLEKALGDALVDGSPLPDRGGRELGEPVEGGWLADDSWEFYEFGGLSALYEKGVSRTRLVLFPTPTLMEMAA